MLPPKGLGVYTNIIRGRQNHDDGKEEEGRTKRQELIESVYAETMRLSSENNKWNHQEGTLKQSTLWYRTACVPSIFRGLRVASMPIPTTQYPSLYHGGGTTFGRNFVMKRFDSTKQLKFANVSAAKCTLPFGISLESFANKSSSFDNFSDTMLRIHTNALDVIAFTVTLECVSAVSRAM